MFDNLISELGLKIDLVNLEIICSRGNNMLPDEVSGVVHFNSLHVHHFLHLGHDSCLFLTADISAEGFNVVSETGH